MSSFGFVRPTIEHLFNNKFTNNNLIFFYNGFYIYVNTIQNK